MFAPENSNGWKAISEFQARRFLLIFLGVGGPNEYRFKKSLIRFEESHRFSSYHPKNTYEKYTEGKILIWGDEVAVVHLSGLQCSYDLLSFGDFELRR